MEKWRMISLAGHKILTDIAPDLRCIDHRMFFMIGKLRLFLFLVSHCLPVPNLKADTLFLIFRAEQNTARPSVTDTATMGQQLQFFYLLKNDVSFDYSSCASDVVP